MTKRRAPMRIPLPGGSGPAPTGAVQFEQDWPGLFIRGDEAIGIAFMIRTLVRKLSDTTDPEVALALVNLERYADLIERDVKV